MGQQGIAQWELASNDVLALRTQQCHLVGWLAILLVVILIGCTQEPRVTFLPNEAYFQALIPHLTQAKHDIVVSMFLFASGSHEHNRANQVKEALIGATKRGVRVRLFLEDSDGEDLTAEANHGAVKDLTRQGITVVFDSPARKTHTKLVIIDQRYVFLGSHNLTHSALRHNNEASVLIESPKLAQQALIYLQHVRALGAQESVSATGRGRPSARQGR